MNKKLALSLGTLVSVASPVIATVSCGKTLPPTEENVSLSSFIKGDLSKKVQMTWLEKAVNQLYSGLDLNKVEVASKWNHKKIVDLANPANLEVLNMIKEHIIINGKGNPAITKTHVVAIQREFRDAIAKNDLIKTGIQKEHRGKINFIATTPANIPTTDEISIDGLNLLFNTEATGIKQKIYQELIASKYLETNKTKISNVFKKQYENNNLTFWEQKISNDNFVLIKELMDKKYFAKWDIAPKFSSNMSGLFTGTETFANMISAISGGTPVAGVTPPTSDGVFAQFANYTTRNKKYFGNEFPLTNASGGTFNYENLIGFEGITSQSPTGKGILSFNRHNASGDTTDHFMKATSESDWEGFLEPKDQKELIRSTNNIKYRKDATSPVHITYLKGIMPIYQASGTTGGEYVLGTNLKTNIAELRRFIAVKNQSLFSEAFKYFRADRGTAADDKAILLSLKDDTNNIIKQELENKNVWAFFDKYTEE